MTEGGASSQYFYENGVLQDELRTTSTGTSQYRYIYNAEGILMQREFDSTDADTLVDSITQYAYEVGDFTNDGLGDVVVTHVFNNVVPAQSIELGSSDEEFLTPENNTAGGLNWGGHDTGSCTTCGNMQGQVNSLLLGF